MTRAIATAISLLSASWFLGAVVLVVGFAEQPQPEQTPRMWVAPSPFEAACVLVEGQPCNLFEWPAK